MLRRRGLASTRAGGLDASGAALLSPPLSSRPVSWAGPRWGPACPYHSPLPLLLPDRSPISPQVSCAASGRLVTLPHQGWLSVGQNHNNCILFGAVWFGCVDINLAQGELRGWLLKTFFTLKRTYIGAWRRDLPPSPVLAWGLCCVRGCAHSTQLLGNHLRAQAWGPTQTVEWQSENNGKSLTLDDVIESEIHWPWSHHGFPYCLRKVKGREIGLKSGP